VNTTIGGVTFFRSRWLTTDGVEELAPASSAPGSGRRGSTAAQGNGGHDVGLSPEMPRMGRRRSARNAAAPIDSEFWSRSRLLDMPGCSHECCLEMEQSNP